MCRLFVIICQSPVLAHHNLYHVDTLNLVSVMFVDANVHTCCSFDFIFSANDHALGLAPFHSPEIWFLIGIRSSTNARALNLDPFNITGQKLFVSKEEFMVITPSISPESQPLKTIEIELPLKARELAEVKKLRKDDILKFFRLVNNKASSVRLPRYNITIAFGHGFVEQGV